MKQDRFGNIVMTIGGFDDYVVLYLEGPNITARLKAPDIDELIRKLAKLRLAITKESPR